MQEELPLEGHRPGRAGALDRQPSCGLVGCTIDAEHAAREAAHCVAACFGAEVEHRRGVTCESEVARRRDELGDETRFADPWIAPDDDDPAASALYAGLRHRPEIAQLLVAPDKGAGIAPRRLARTADPVGDEPLLLALQREPVRCLSIEGLGHLLPRRRVDDDLGRGRSAAQARCGVDGVAGEREVTGPGIAASRHDQPGGDAGVHRQVPGEGGVERGEIGVDHAMQLERRLDGTDGVVAACNRDAEQGHDLVADELVDGPAVAFDGAAGLRLDPGHQRLDVFRIERLVQCRVAAQVAEHHRSLASFAVVGDERDGGGTCRDVLAATGAEALTVHHRGAASRAGRADWRAAGGAEPGAGWNVGLATNADHRCPNSCETPSWPVGRRAGKRFPGVALQAPDARHTIVGFPGSAPFQKARCGVGT